MPDCPESRPLSPADALQVRAAAPAPRQTVLWVIAGLLALIAVLLVARSDEAFFRSALAQAADPLRGNLDGGRGIYAFTGQVSARSYGLFMLDVDTGTVWCYELQRSGPNNEPRLNLVAARSWVFDRYLEEFNTGDPIPSAVRMLVQQQRSNRSPATQPGISGAGSN